MKINFSNQIFGKKLAATAVIGGQSPKNVNIYKLNDKEDIKYLRQANENENWRGNCYLIDIIYDFEYNFPYYDFYLMEEKGTKEIICAAEACRRNNQKTYLNHIETAPKFKHNGKGLRKYRFAGETMLTFIAKLAQQQNESLTIMQPDAEAKGFYIENCNLKEPKHNDIYLNSNQELENFIKLNESHTGHKIEMMV